MRPYELFLAHMFSSRDPGDFPFRITVESTNLCNLRCPICPRENSNRGYGFVDFDLFADIARQASGRESVFYPQGFGEPFLHPRFPEMLALLNEAGVRCTDLITNATYLDEKNCHAIIDASTTILTVSLDGADAEVYESVRPNASYEEVVRNILTLLRLRKERQAEFPILVLSVVGTPEVQATMSAFREFWEPRLRDSDEIFVCSPVTWAGDLRISGREGAKGGADLPSRPPCRMLYKTIQVYYDGRVTPCCYDHACALEVGNAKEESIEEIWKGERLTRLRALHEAGRSGEIPLCRDCPDHMP